MDQEMMHRDAAYAEAPCCLRKVPSFLHGDGNPVGQGKANANHPYQVMRREEEKSFLLWSEKNWNEFIQARKEIDELTKEIDELTAAMLEAEDLTWPASGQVKFKGSMDWMKVPLHVCIIRGQMQCHIKKQPKKGSHKKRTLQSVSWVPPAFTDTDMPPNYW